MVTGNNSWNILSPIREEVIPAVNLHTAEKLFAILAVRYLLSEFLLPAADLATVRGA